MPIDMTGAPRSTRQLPILALCAVVGGLALPVPVNAGPTHLPFTRPASADFAPARINDQTVTLIAGLIEIERDLLLGQLFLQDGLVEGEASHFAQPRKDSFPMIRDGLAKAGAPDLEPLLIALEEARGKDAVTAAYAAALGGLQKAKAALHPTEQDIIGAVIRSAETAVTLLDPSGTTGVAAYQEAWGLLIAARGKLDALTASTDPAVKASAAAMALAFDDVILFAPDPNAKGPVAFDPALVTQLVTALKGQAGSI